MRCRHDYAINGKTSAFFGSGSDVLGCEWRRNFIPKGDGFSFSQSRLVPLAKKMCTITAKQNNCRFLVHKRNIQNVAAGFGLFTVKKIIVPLLVEIKTHFRFCMLDNTHLQ